ncbi:MAG: alpha-ketoglutarate-dependent dioxygenase AlkB family protein [Maritimibacter sp.]
MFEQETALNVGGARLFPGVLGLSAQRNLVEDLREIVRQAPLFSPQTRGQGQMSVRMTSAGAFGWYSDAGGGYRYEPQHPNGTPWPDIPANLRLIWSALAPKSPAPECCLLNFYGEGARMGLHQDCDEADFSHPVVSISLGDEGLFRIGGERRGGPTKSIWLKSGDVIVLEGEARLAYHGVDRIKFGSSTLLREGGRINITMRVVT